MTATMTLATWLEEQLAADEAVALAATHGPWGHNPGKVWLTDPEMLRLYRAGTQTFTAEEFVSANVNDDVTCVATTGPEDNLQSMADAAHIALHDPARVLAQIAAVREVLALHAPIDPCDAHNASFETVPCDTLRALAKPYADRPGYAEVAG